MNSFLPKQLRVTLMTGGVATFPGTGDNTLVLSNLCVSATVQAIASQATSADIRIYGMLPQEMNALTTIWFHQDTVLDQSVILEANDGSGWTQVFSGTMIESQPDYRAAPDVFFGIQALVGYFAQMSPAPPTSFQNGADAATALSTLATAMGFKLINNGVTAQLPVGAYFPGSLFDQFSTICRDYSIDYYFDGNAIAIVPLKAPRANTPSVILSPQSGLIGYPVFQRFGIEVNCLFNPAITGGGPITVQGSDLPGANGNWIPYSVTHMLESMVPDGKWMSTIACLPVPT